jgi:hypothetical protein
MKKTEITLGLVIFMASLGGIALFLESSALVFGYLVVSTLLFVLVAVGGVLNYFKQENVDFREVYREKYKMQKERLTVLEKSFAQQKTTL